jgi:hypothetical protein
LWIRNRGEGVVKNDLVEIHMNSLTITIIKDLGVASCR